MWIANSGIKLFIIKLVYRWCNPLNNPAATVQSTFVKQFQEPDRLMWPEGYTKHRYSLDGQQVGYSDSLGRWYARWDFLLWTFELNSENIGIVSRRYV